MTRCRAGVLHRVLLGAGAACLIVSMFLPPGHHRNHHALLLEDARVLPGYARDGEWLVTAYWGGRVVALSAPSWLGAFFLLVAFLPRGRYLGVLSAVNHLLLLCGIATAGWAAYALELSTELPDDEPVSAAVERARSLFLSAGVVLTALVLAQAAVVLRITRVKRASGEILHFLPLSFLLVLGTGMAVAMWNNDQWHRADYVVIAAGSALCLAATWIRWRQERAAIDGPGALRRATTLPTCGGEGFQPGVDLDDSAALLELMDRPDDPHRARDE